MDIDGYALVTGAGSGIGRGCAIAYAVEGAAGVVFADMNKAAAEKAATESLSVATNPKYRALIMQVDVTKEDAVNAMIDETIKEFGRIDYALNSAGIGVQAPAEIAEASTSEYRNFLDVNVFGMFLVVRAESAVMKKQDLKPVNGKNAKRGGNRGVIVNMGSCSSYVATPQLGQYTTSKHAVLGLTRNADNSRHNVRVNCLCPSWVDTPMVSKAVAGNSSLQALMESAVPMGRIAQVDEIADVVMFLSSPRASYVTGSSWIVDGGTTLTTHAS
ncbi:MAG: hypothetical protein Q9164_001625 [Protoblastenia rupestris]